MLLQKQSKNKDSFPECSTLLQPDISKQVMNRSESALRELEEELGIHATPEQLHFAGTFPISFAKRITEKCSAMKNSHLCIFMISQWISRS